EGPETGYKFSRKLLYGTDWYFPDAAVRSQVLAKTEQVFLHPSLKEHYEDYFCGNAARYLNEAAKLPHLNSSAVKARLRPFDQYWTGLSPRPGKLSRSLCTRHAPRQRRHPPPRPCASC